jgi:hypothetical protein
LTFAGVTAALSDIKYIMSATSKESPQVCHLLKCPRLGNLATAVDETIEVLKKTKGSFKSKELGRIRKKLEKIVKNTKNI